MAKYDAADRQASGEPVPEEIQRLLGNLIASATSSGEVLDIYDAAGMPKPSLDDLTPEFIAKTQQARNPQLAIEALRKLIAYESAKMTRNNVIRQRAFSERITELMTKYTNQQLTSAEVIAELVELAARWPPRAMQCETIPYEPAGKTTLFPGLELWNEVTQRITDHSGDDLEVVSRLIEEKCEVHRFTVTQRPGGPAVTGIALRDFSFPAIVQSDPRGRSTVQNSPRAAG